jgi:hypothetical protein
MNTHYAVITFSGDPAREHPDEELRGHEPSLQLIACGSEEFCWESVVTWTAAHPLRQWEDVEVLGRGPEILANTRALLAARGEPVERASDV